MRNLSAKSCDLRMDIVDMVYTAKTGHIGGDMSVCDILNILYNRHMNISPENFKDKNRDRFILSKGHCAEALYAVLADKGFFPKADLARFSAFGSPYMGHPNNKLPGVEINSGSLGHGLSVAVGMALAGKMDFASYRVYTVMGDGELAEGSVWEAAMSAGHYKLDNLTAVVDRNGLQISGATEKVMAHEDLAARWTAFGWHVITADGNDMESLDAALTAAKEYKGKPSVIIAKTIKGLGISFMENNPSWHHGVLNTEQYEQAKRELAERRAKYE
jgi:transketolase